MYRQHDPKFQNARKLCKQLGKIIQRKYKHVAKMPSQRLSQATINNSVIDSIIAISLNKIAQKIAKYSPQFSNDEPDSYLVATHHFLMELSNIKVLDYLHLDTHSHQQYIKLKRKDYRYAYVPKKDWQRKGTHKFPDGFTCNDYLITNLYILPKSKILKLLKNMYNSLSLKHLEQVDLEVIKDKLPLAKEIYKDSIYNVKHYRKYIEQSNQRIKKIKHDLKLK